MNTPPIQQTSLVSELPTAQKKRLELWAERAISEHWLSENTLEQLSASVNATPGQLFEQSSHRPLVTGLFGGTGVGKSTLLNRLAGEPIARASAERPTSRDITIYVHRSVSVDHLPDNLPMQRMRTALHNNDDYQHVMFVDMPDFDSVEQSNRDLVNLWLPHLDVVMYVVSPERYRDDQGWRLLREHAAAHAWLFIINQWDRGDPLVRDDFIDQLAAQGLSAPMVFTTDCANPDHAPESNPALATDDFNALQETLLTLSDEQIISALQEHGVVARLQTLKSLSDSWIDGLGSTPSFDSLQQSWLQACEQEHDKTRSTTQLSIFQIAAQFADNTPFWKRLFGLVKPGSPDKPNALTPLTETLNERLLSTLERFCNQQAGTGMDQCPDCGCFHTRQQQPGCLSGQPVCCQQRDVAWRQLADTGIGQYIIQPLAGTGCKAGSCAGRGRGDCKYSGSGRLSIHRPGRSGGHAARRLSAIVGRIAGT